METNRSESALLSIGICNNFSQYFVFGIALLCTLLQLGCRSGQLDLQTYKGPQLIFGSGGGFSGSTTSYILIENGQLFKMNSLAGDTIALSDVKRKVTKDLFQEYEKLASQQPYFNHPGNLYYFIEQKNAGKKTRITWGDTQHTVPDSVMTFYQKLQNIIPKSAP